MGAKHYFVERNGHARRSDRCPLGLLAICISVPPSLAETGFVRVIITKRALIIGTGEGTGTLTFLGHGYPLRISGMSFGATIGASRTTLTGHARNMGTPSDIEGTYAAVSSGSALLVGAGGAHLKNDKGVDLLLSGVKVGAEMTVAVGGVTISIRAKSPKGSPRSSPGSHGRGFSDAITRNAFMVTAP